MKFNVRRSKTFTLEENSIIIFKDEMLARLEEELYENGTLKEGDRFPCTFEDISDDIVEKALAEAIQYAFEEPGYVYSGFAFDECFNTVSIYSIEDDVKDCIYEALENWRKEIGV
jgi:hypothetical protein